MKKVKVAFIGRTNVNGWSQRAYTEIPFNKENSTTGTNLRFVPATGKSLALIHLDENTARTLTVGAELNVHVIDDITGFISYETVAGQGIANATASKDASAIDTLKRSVNIVTKAGIPESLMELAFSKTFDNLATGKNAGKTARKGLRGNGLQQIVAVAQDATATEITSPLNESKQ
jgi:hypothetical protein